MQELLEEIREKLGKLEERGERVEKKIDDFKSDLTRIRTENEKLRKENQIIKQNMLEQDRKIEEMEREIRKRNIIIHGVEEQGEESELQLKEKVRVILRDIGIIMNMEEEVKEVRRIGKRQERKCRPIKIEVGSWNKKIEVLKATKKIKRYKNLHRGRFLKRSAKTKKRTNKTYEAN